MRDASSPDPQTDAIDVVVPARDAAGTLSACLSGLAEAGFAPDSIIVVDDGSRDATAAIAGAARARIVRTSGAGAAAARNAGAGAGAAPLILFVDADIVPAPDLRRAVAESLSAHPDHAAIFGAYDDAPRAPGLISRARNLLHAHVHRINAGEARTFWTGLGVVRRADFEAVGGFDPEQRMMEDVAFGMDLAASGRRVLLDPRLTGTHLKGWSLVSMIRTDLRDRAIPWTRLMLTRPDTPGPGLNVSRSGQVSVLAAGAALLAAGSVLVAPLAGLAALGGSLGVLTAANRGFLARLLWDRGPGFALGALGMLWAHYLAGGAGYAWVRFIQRPRPVSSARTIRDTSAPR